jgi:hypothetical protein
MTEPLDRLPEEVRVALAEFAHVIGGLEAILLSLQAAGRDEARGLDELIGRMSRWAWPLLGELDEGEGYDG